MLNGKVYVVGGWSGNNGLANCEVYDPVKEKWSFIADLTVGKVKYIKYKIQDIKDMSFIFHFYPYKEE